MQLAKRLEKLGTETAFAVSVKAAEWAARGNRVYPFHIGDINLPTSQNIVDAALRAIKDGKTGYAPSAGIMPLREKLAEDVGKRRGVTYSPEEVSIQPGGKPVVSKFILTVMNPGDEVLYPNPGYPIYESQIEFNGGIAKPYGFIETEHGFDIDLDQLEFLITPKTKILIYNNFHNPLGAESSEEEMKYLAKLAIRNDLYVLSDEAYYEIRYSGNSSSIVKFPEMKERTVVLYTFSKKFAMTGWRLGAALGPKQIIDVISRLNVNNESCSNHFVQWAGVEALTGDQSGCIELIRVLKDRRDVTYSALVSIEGVRVHKPETTFYLFPNVTGVVKRKGFSNLQQFSDKVLKSTGVSFCTRKHFGKPLPGEDQYYIRFAYSGIDIPEIQEGLSKFKEWIEA